MACGARSAKCDVFNQKAREFSRTFFEVTRAVRHTAPSLGFGSVLFVVFLFRAVMHRVEVSAPFFLIIFHVCVTL